MFQSVIRPVIRMFFWLRCSSLMSSWGWLQQIHHGIHAYGHYSDKHAACGHANGLESVGSFWCFSDLILFIVSSNQIYRGHWRDELSPRLRDSGRLPRAAYLLDGCWSRQSGEAVWLRLLTYIQSEGSNAYYVNSSAIFSGKLCQLFCPGPLLPD